MFFQLTGGIITKISTCALALGSHAGGGRGGDSSGNSNIGGWVDGLYRYACKGLSADSLERVTFFQPGDAFPDDRIYALLKIDAQQQQQQQGQFDPENPQWLHKENFVCAFSAPKFLAQFESRYNHDTKCLSLYQRSSSRSMDDGNNINNNNNSQSPYPLSLLLLDSVNLSTTNGRQALADFFSVESGIPVMCVTAATTAKRKENHNSHHQHQHHHQFGNTSSGWKQKKDTRTIHIVNAATVRAVSKAIGIPLNPTRFRPNIVIDGIPAWSEFDWVQPQQRPQEQEQEQKQDNLIQIGSTKLEVIARTVRCDGVSVDPLDMDNVIDIPKCLIRHFPEHGPYLGVYAVVHQGGVISVGDQVIASTTMLVENQSPSGSEIGPSSSGNAALEVMSPLPDSRRSILLQAALSSVATLVHPMTAFAEDDSASSTSTATSTITSLSPSTTPTTTTALSSVVEVTPSLPEAKKLFNEGRAFELQGNMAAAQRLYAKVIKISPRFIYGWSNLGNTQVAMGDLAGADENYSQAISLCQELAATTTTTRKCNDLYLLLLNRGSVRLNTPGMAQEALNDLQQADTLRQRPDALILQNLARAKELNGMFASSDRDYTVSIAMTANEVNPFWLRSAMVKLQLGDVKGGMDLLKRVENRFPDAPEVKAASATFLAKQGQPIEALRKYLEIPDRQRRRFADDDYLQRVVAWPPTMIDGITKIAKAVGDR
jgi:uncharacterized protein